MNLINKILEYIIPIVAGGICLFFAIKGYPMAKKNPSKKKRNILGMILGGGLIIVSLILIIFL